MKTPKWRTPRRKAFTPEGFTLGAEVRGAIVKRFEVEFNDQVIEWHATTEITGQIWAKAAPRGTWWVVTRDGTAHLAHEYDLTVLGQCNESLPLFVYTAA